jgi:hypothetical protein
MTITPLKRRDGPVNATEDDDGNRVYTHPITGERWWSVTTVYSIVGKEGLPYWAANLAARAAVDYLPRLVRQCRRTTPCGGTTLEDRCGDCADCAYHFLAMRHIAERDAAGDRGKRVHKAAEHHEIHGRWPDDIDDDTNADIRPYLEQYTRWRADFEPTFIASEATVISRTHGYAGTLDAILTLGWTHPNQAELRSVPLCVDWKTGKDVYDEAGWQNAAYRHADAILLDNGDELPLPETTGGLVVHLTPDNYHVRPLCNDTAAFAEFLDVLALYKRMVARESSLIGRALLKPSASTKDGTPKRTRKPRTRAADPVPC